MKEHNIKRHHKEQSAIEEKRKEDCNRRAADIQRQASLFKKTFVTQTAAAGNTVASKLKEEFVGLFKDFDASSL